MRNVGIIGNGVMGVGIASICAYYGYNVILLARSVEKSESALGMINNNVKRLVKRHGIADKLGVVECGNEISALAKAHMVIECVAEDFTVKKNVYKSLQNILRNDTIIATNTSSISIGKLARTTDRPDRFIGMHFMNPATIIPLTELIKSDTTSKNTVENSKNFLNSMKRTIVSAADTPGFIVNRLLITMINEAANLVHTKIGNIEDIDTCMKIGANHPLGPLALADLIGIDVCLAIMETIHSETGDGKYEPSPLLYHYCETGKLGRKSKQGFYNY